MLYRHHKKLVNLAVIVLITIAAGFAGYRLAQDEPRIVPQEQEDIPAGAGDERVEAGAEMIWHIHYEMCGHSVTINSVADDSIAGCSFSRLSEILPDARIVSFSSDKLELKRSFACYCPDHFVLKKNGEGLAVYKTAAGTEKQDIYVELPIKFGEIDEKWQPALEIGRVFGSFSDLQAFVEKLRQ